jgi:hypothetical protein
MFPVVEQSFAEFNEKVLQKIMKFNDYMKSFNDWGGGSYLLITTNSLYGVPASLGKFSILDHFHKSSYKLQN